MIKAVIIGFTHMHVNEVALYLSEQPDFELAAVAGAPHDAEEIPPYRYTPVWNMQNVREKYCGRYYEDYRAMLDEVKPDIAFLFCEIRKKPEIVEECARRNVNLCIEKPLAATYEDALRIQSIVRKYGVEAYVNWPVFWRGYIHKMMNALNAGLVGEPLMLRYLNGHTGPLGKGARHRGVTESADEMTDAMRAKTCWYQPALSGGAFVDIGCYGCLYSEWILGADAKSVLACGTNLNTPFADTEDNCVAVVKYEGGKMAVLEGTWTTPRSLIPSGPAVTCSDGVIVCTGGAEGLPDVKAYDLYGSEVPVPEMKPDEKYRNMPWHYAHHVKTGEPVHPVVSLDMNVNITALLDAAVRSAKSGKEEKIHG